MYPLLFAPVYKDYIWGGSRIARCYGRKDVPAVCAESWEVSDRPEGMSIVGNGALAGSSIHELLEKYGEDLLGRGRTADVFPLLIKIIDAEKRLSVQVHPDDETAARYGGDAKTEMWYILDAAPGARIFTGVKAGTTPEAFKNALEDERLEDVLNSLPVQAGDAVFTPGGRLHAIGEGCLLLEIQQNSNTTYRVYDWGRVGQDGKPRPLHVDRALQVINWRDDRSLTMKHEDPVFHKGNSFRQVLACPYFIVEQIELAAPETLCNDGTSFHALFTESGTVQIDGAGASELLGQGTSCLLPASLEQYTIAPVNENAALIRTSLPG